MLNEREMMNAAQPRTTARAMRASELLEPGGPVAAAGEAREARSTHMLSLLSAYGDTLAIEEVAPADLPAALRRFHHQVLERGSAMVVIDGITHSRNAFLEFVREFNECHARAQRSQLH